MPLPAKRAQGLRGLFAACQERIVLGKVLQCAFGLRSAQNAQGMGDVEAVVEAALFQRRDHAGTTLRSPMAASTSGI